MDINNLKLNSGEIFFTFATKSEFEEKKKKYESIRFLHDAVNDNGKHAVVIAISEFKKICHKKS